jgi:multiple sugar transport system permease protein
MSEGLMWPRESLVPRESRLSRSARPWLGRLVGSIVMLAAALFFGIPVLWLILAPTKTSYQLNHGFPFSIGNPMNIVTAWRHLYEFRDGEILRWIANSVYYSVTSVALGVVLCVTAGYGLAKYTFVGRKTVLLTTLISMIVPGAALILPLYVEMAALHLIGTAAAVILPSAYFPFGVYLAYIFFSTSMPNTLLEAARVDGASEARIFFTIALPLARPMIGLVAFFSFVGVWSNFMLPYLMLTSDQSFPLPVGLTALPLFDAVTGMPTSFSSLPIHEPEAALAGLISVLPILLVFLFAQRFLVAGQLTGADKN